MTANYVARPVGYHMTKGWMQGDRATQIYFRPLEAFAARFDRYLRDVRALGYQAIDLWLAILHPGWATDGHIIAARDLLRQHGLPVVSLAGGFGETREEFDAVCRLAARLDCTILGGGTSLLETDRDYVVARLRAGGLKLGIENHPEKSPGEMLARLGEDDADVIGTAVDTGWYGTQGYDAAQALSELSDRLFHVHLKDVRQPGAHDTCRFGEGCVPVEACVQTLRAVGYAGPISIEHEPERFDPTEDLKVNLQLLKEWMAS
ncbi:MAG: sugar phosphate isomerase/epimerase [Anaerolineae bacterium]|nr:sugar phosphate isomerase/epimerase [Anaerolineae bacterium]